MMGGVAVKRAESNIHKAAPFFIVKLHDAGGSMIHVLNRGGVVGLLNC